MLRDGQPAFSDLVTIIPFIGFFLMMRFIIYDIVFRISPAIIRFNKPTVSNEEIEVKKHRAADQLVKIIFHATAALFAAQYFGRFDWWIPNLINFRSFMKMPLKTMDKVYYMYQAGYHMHSLFHFFLLEKNTKADDFVMGLHHIVTVILIFASYLGGSPYFQFGAVVYYVHDASDVFVALVKISNYLHLPSICLVFGLLFALGGWIYFRIYIFGVHIILVAGYGTIMEFNTRGVESFAVTGVIFTVLMLSLWIMHCYWLKAIVLSLIRVVTKVNPSSYDVSDTKEVNNNQTTQTTEKVKTQKDE